jgi:clan AA aspartic protease
MITGRVANREGLIELHVAGPGQPAQQIEAVIDTGYNGYLTLPSHLVPGLRLRFAGHRRGTLADGSVTVLDVYVAVVIWHGREQEVLVSQAAGAPLVGMSLLQGSRMTMDVVEGGDIAIYELRDGG